MKRVATATLLISVLSVLPSKAQYTVQGLLLNESSQPIAYANAALLDPNDSSMVGGGISNENGEFTIEKVKEGEYLLLCSLLGFTSHSQRLDISSDVNLNEILMEEGTSALEEVVVHGQRPAFEMTSSALVVNVSSSPVLQNGNLLQMMGRLPGVSFGQNNSLQYKGNGNVMVIINGKQTYLSQEQLSNLLENTPTENVEKVELMDNPPAKYDATGTAGLINIVLKKPEDLGTNGSVSLNIGQGRFEKVNPSVVLNHRTGKLNLFGTYSYNYNKSFREMEISRDLANIDLETGESIGGTTTIDQLPYWIYPRQSHNFSFGTDWFVGNKTTLGLLLNGTGIVHRGRDHVTTSLSGEYQNPFDQTESFTITDGSYQNINMNLNFKHEFRNGGVLNFD